MTIFYTVDGLTLSLNTGKYFLTTISSYQPEKKILFLFQIDEDAVGSTTSLQQVVHKILTL